MDTVGAIIRARRETLGLSLAAVAQGAGLTKGYLSMIENGKVERPPSPAALAALERALGIGEGELRRAADWQKTPAQVRRRVEHLEDQTRKARELARWLRESTHKRRDGGRNLDKLFRSGELTRRVNAALRANPSAPDQPPNQTPEPTADAPRDAGSKARPPRGGELDARVGVRFQVPIINKVAAGYPSDFTDLDFPARVADEFVPCPGLDDPQAFAARVCGESMQPEYREGDVIVFSPAAPITQGCDCFVRLEPDHESTFKRVFFDAGKPAQSATIRLQPLNPAFPPMTVPRERVAGLYRAVWRFQRL